MYYRLQRKHCKGTVSVVRFIREAEIMHLDLQFTNMHTVGILLFTYINSFRIRAVFFVKMLSDGCAKQSTI